MTSLELPNQLLNQYVQALTLERMDRSFQAMFCMASIPLTVLQRQAATFLHPLEAAYFATLAFEKRQQTYLLGHFVAKQAIAHLTRRQGLVDILLDYGVFHYPVVQNLQEKIQVSYTHSHSWAMALAFPEAHPLGIDLEAIALEKVSGIETQLTPDEKQFLDQTSQKALFATLFWTAKEALSKILRTGMMTPFTVYAMTTPIQEENGYWTSEFINFAQYKSLSFQVESSICSIVYPKKTHLVIDIPAIQTAFASKKMG